MMANVPRWVNILGIVAGWLLAALFALYAGLMVFFGAEHAAWMLVVVPAGAVGYFGGWGFVRLVALVGRRLRNRRHHTS